MEILENKRDCYYFTVGVLSAIKEQFISELNTQGGNIGITSIIDEKQRIKLYICGASRNFKKQVKGIYYKIKKEYYANVGATFSNQAKLKAENESYWYSAIGDVGSSLYSYLADSVVGKKGNTILPSKLGLGVQVGNGDYWKAGFDYITSDWSQYRSFGQADSFAKATTVRLGGEITPDVNEKFNGWKRVTYRLGGYYIQEPLKLNNTQLNSQAITVGIGYPIRRTLMSIGQVNAAFELGKRGTLENSLLQENFTRFSIGVTLNDKWFMKRKYD